MRKLQGNCCTCTRTMNNLQHILTITKLKHAIMTSLDTRQVKLLWLLQITAVNNYMTAIKDLQQQQEIMLRNIAIDHEK
jgi:hypothetical protein